MSRDYGPASRTPTLEHLISLRQYNLNQRDINKAAKNPYQVNQCEKLNNLYDMLIGEFRSNGTIRNPEVFRLKYKESQILSVEYEACKERLEKEKKESPAQQKLESEQLSDGSDEAGNTEKPDGSTSKVVQAAKESSDVTDFNETGETSQGDAVGKESQEQPGPSEDAQTAVVFNNVTNLMNFINLDNTKN